MKYRVCDYRKNLENGIFCERECERPWCSGCPDSRRIRIEDRIYYYCEISGAFKTMNDRCDLPEGKAK